MERVRIILTIFFLNVLLITSCNQDFLDTKPLDEFSDADVWKDPALAKAFINGIYQNLTYDFAKYSRCIFEDDGHRRAAAAVLNFNRSMMTADIIPGWGLENWQGLFSSIRRCNLFLDRIEKADFEDKDTMIGEVKFLRAWLYHYMASLYGGIPIISKVYTLSDDFKAPRDTYEDVIKFIVEDCDQAASLLPEIQSGNNFGRPTKGAALALKSRVLLYAASDLHNTIVFPDYTNPELIGYTDKSAAARFARWQAAKNAAKAVIDLNKYGLYKATPGLNDSVAKNYEELFILKKHEEDIWTKFYTPTSGGTDLAYMNNSNGYGGLSCNTPTGNLVDAFEMKDGTKFDWNNPSHAAFPYKNRDQRFYAYILYEGAKWRNRPAFSIGMDPIGIMQFGRWETWNASTSQVVYIGGLDSQWSPYTPANNSYTRYIARKFLDPNHEASLASKQDVPHRRIRYAEILLNYAESCIELGEDAEARTYLNMLRKRAGQPALTESGEALLARCRNERRVELMYEEQRFFDIRRWAIGPDAYNISVTKANILYKLLPDKTTATVPTITHEVVETRAWNNKAYFFPILRDEMNKNDKLIQNPGY